MKLFSALVQGNRKRDDRVPGWNGRTITTTIGLVSVGRHRMKDSTRQLTEASPIYRST
jgi:hypothetical protein